MWEANNTWNLVSAGILRGVHSFSRDVFAGSGLGERGSLETFFAQQSLLTSAKPGNLLYVVRTLSCVLVFTELYHPTSS